MPIIVNTNTASINAQRQLVKSGGALNKALERLSSGLRINRAADDAAGLAIATDLNSQVRGLNVAVRNANDGISAIQIANGALESMTEILQRVRELSIQAANDGLYTADNLDSIQNEIESEVDELTRIGNTAQFNGLGLLNGQFSNKRLQIGAEAGQTFSVNIEDYRANQIGKYAEAVGTAIDIDAAAQIDGTDDNSGNSLLINSVAVGATITDEISWDTSTGSAIAKATAINDIESETGVHATAQAAVLTGDTDIDASGTMDGTGTTTFSINGVTIYDEATDGALAVTADDGTGVLRALINDHSNETGVVATIDSHRLVLTADDGRNVTVVTTNYGDGDEQGDLGFTAASGVGLGGAATHHATGTIDLTSNDVFTVSADDATQIGIASGSYAPSTENRVAAIDVTSQAGAQGAIRSVDTALNEISDAQAYLGALMNRLDHTISNLYISIENMSASESRIRDADYAAETANLTRAQIIQQSSVAILAQANLVPQSALALLG